MDGKQYINLTSIYPIPDKNIPILLNITGQEREYTKADKRDLNNECNG
jgi:hypothetical protein